MKCERCGEVNPAEIHTCSPQCRKVGEETARVTISMMRSLAKNIPISPFHLAAADDMEALLNEVLKYRKENT